MCQKEPLASLPTQWAESCSFERRTERNLQFKSARTAHIHLLLHRGSRVAIPHALFCLRWNHPRRLKEIVIAANKTKARLIYIAAAPRSFLERLLHGYSLENVLRNAGCDVAIYGGAR